MKGSTEIKTSHGIIIIFGFILLMGFVLCPCSATRSRELATRTQCQSNLHQFDLALSGYCYPPINEYPERLSMLSSNDVSPELFVCPHTGNEPGELENADEWMDYMYRVGESPATPAGIAIMICPPYSHGGLGGCILNSDHSTRYVPREQLDALIESNKQFLAVSRRVCMQSVGEYCKHWDGDGCPHHGVTREEAEVAAAEMEKRQAGYQRRRTMWDIRRHVEMLLPLVIVVALLSAFVISVFRWVIRMCVSY